MEYPVTVNGAPLDTWAYDVTTRTGWHSSPGVRGVSVEAAHVDGVLVPDRRTPLEPGQIALSMWVRGRTWAEYVANLDSLKAIFSTQRGPVAVTMDVGDWQVRTCQARTVASWAPSHKSPLHAEFTVVMEIPAGVWTSADYHLRRQGSVTAATPVLVDCGDPTATVTDSLLLMWDAGATARRWTIRDATDPDGREWARLTLPATVSTSRSLMWDFRRWRVTEIGRPSVDAIDAAWFASPPEGYLADHTDRVQRNGPMTGSGLLTLDPGGPLAPRQPGVTIEATNVSGTPVSVPAVWLAVRPTWL